MEYGLQEFLREVWVYQPGNRVTILGPSGAGKTEFAFKLLEVTATPKLPAIVLVMKPIDKTVTRWGKRLKFVLTQVWPPVLRWWFTRQPSGYLLWPKHDLTNFEATNVNMFRQFRRAIIDAYKHQKTWRGKKLRGKIVFADELASLDEELGMEPEIKMMYSRGRSMSAGMWGGSQRPRDCPVIVYSSADDLFLSYMPDKADRKRFAEIGGGIDPEIIEEVTLRLPLYWWCYARRKDRTICIIRAD